MNAIAALRGLLVAAFVAACAMPDGAGAAGTPAASFAWTVKAIPVMTRSPGEPIAISVVVGALPASGVAVVQSALVERIWKRPLAPTGLRLCRTATQDCSGQPLDLPANSAAALWLWGAEGIGVFEGSVTLAARERPDGDAVAMTVNSSSTARKLGGVVTLIASIFLTWLLAVVVRNYANRMQLMLPVSLALQTLSSLRDEVKAGEPQLPATKLLRKLDDIEGQLAIPLLENNGLPPRVPLAGLSAGANLDAYKKHVQLQNDWLLAISVLVREGLQPAWDRWSSVDAGTRLQLTKMVANIDALSHGITAPTVDAMRVALKDIAAPMVAGVKGGPLRANVSQVGTPEQLLVQVAGLSAAGWAFLLLMTTLGGAYILVLGPAGAGFGTATDYAQCLLWGAGMPAGAQLMQSTTASIATTFGVTR